MIFIYVALIISLSLSLGIFLGARMRGQAYHGFMVIEESNKGLVYRLEFMGDPELLVFEEAVFFKVVPPNYQDLLRDGN